MSDHEHFDDGQHEFEDGVYGFDDGHDDLGDTHHDSPADAWGHNAASHDDQATPEPHEPAIPPPDYVDHAGLADDVSGYADAELSAWLAEPPPVELTEAQPGSAGSLGDLEFEGWLGDALATPPHDAGGPPSSDELIDWALGERPR